MFNKNISTAEVNNIPDNITRKRDNSLFMLINPSGLSSYRVFTEEPYIETIEYIEGEQVHKRQNIEVISINHTFDKRLIIEYCFK